MFIWRPVLAGRVSIGEIKRGEVDIDDLAKLNALLDFRAAMEDAAAKKSKVH